VNRDEKAVADVLNTYQDALVRSDLDGCIRLYAPDGVFMPQNSPSSIGIDAVRNAYAAVFRAIELSVVFRIEEVRQLASDWVMARTNSSGTVKVHATGERAAEGNQELFLFQKLGGEWKIARYCFSSTNPVGA
jgi:uncharacterized protein (TIGR02246 family)